MSCPPHCSCPLPPFAWVSERPLSSETACGENPPPPSLGTALGEQGSSQPPAISSNLVLAFRVELGKETKKEPCGAPVSRDKVLSWGIPSGGSDLCSVCRGCPHLLPAHVPHPGNRLRLQGSGLDLGTGDQAQRCVQNCRRQCRPRHG